jgi:hypothetical protein
MAMWAIILNTKDMKTGLVKFNDPGWYGHWPVVVGNQMVV